jgi:phosphoserine phosphatase
VISHVRAHQKLGRPTYLVTASPREIASRISEILGMDGYLATELEIVDGFYTGRLAAPVVHGPRKAAEVAVLAARDGIRLDASYMYSDSANDLPLLRQVRYPVVVNGNRDMFTVALNEGWAFLDTDRPERSLWPAKCPDPLAAKDVVAGDGSVVPLADHLHHAHVDR